MKNKLIVLSGILLSSAPVVALAQTTGGTPVSCSAYVGQSNLNAFLCKIGELLNAVIPILIALGVVFFIWGVISYVIGSDEEAKKKGRDRMIYGIIGLVVIVGLWGLVRLVTNTFGLDNKTNITLPTVSY
ncbi:hypothetical protein A3G06_01540 [Candidatus Nomurabacteria bacterium RIFCSPLOWO2_12_FULL_46_14]|uniref:DUF4190 domain-containing protein n=1 Tax=Candidatus Nomurabacteria bacterium RIFCSPLOWO2_12_FULL_46_14 TaxID=1801797 RepID=A0A1F6YBZ5_9BACT|nr:MAG: hypothetical protein A3G06_01540 [Candidatus Nomurabacteria bacterium RIFCSPLOWO2_12_FULL_46_14]